MTNFFLLNLMIATVLFSGCATYHAQNCTENAGYEKGLNDAKMGRLMAMGQFAVFCSEQDVPLAQKGYKAGYDAGKKSEGGPQMNLTFQDGKLGLVGAYSCQITYQGQTFKDQAASEAQARNNVLDSCRKKFPGCMENSISCAKN